MKKLVIKSKDQYSNYILEDNQNNQYEVNINFIDIESPNVGDYIYIKEKVLEERVSLNYGMIDDQFNIDEEELIILIKNDQKIYLQRFYG